MTALPPHESADTKGRRSRLLVFVIVVGIAILAAAASWVILRHERGSQPYQAHSRPLVPSSSTPHPTRHTALTPAHGAYLGAWVQPRPQTQAGYVDSFDTFERSLGTRLAIAHNFVPWRTPLATESTLQFILSGHHVLASWALADIAQIARGHHDAAIRSMAAQVKALGTPIFLEPRWEMDRPNLAATVHSPADFITAWKLIRRIFDKQHVSNIAWVWCPTAAGFASGRAQQFYPGDRQVDWVCADVYPAGQPGTDRFQPFSTLAAPFVHWAEQHPLPAMIGEFGDSVAYGSRRAEWLAGAFAYAKSHPVIKAIVYFEQSDPNVPVDLRWALRDNARALRIFADAAKSRYFMGAS